MINNFYINKSKGDMTMYYTVYLTTNLINGKIYVGKHYTYNPDDGYLGSGKTMLKAIKKYGKENFKKVILHYCLDYDQMNYWENHIVDENFIERKDTYNINIGGLSSFTPNFWTDERKLKKSISSKGELNPNFGGKITKQPSVRAKISKNHMDVSGGNNPNSKKWLVTSPTGEEFLVEGNLVQFCLNHNLSAWSIANTAKTNTPMIKGKNKGWFAIYV
jgi:hypothetical protein